MNVHDSEKVANLLYHDGYVATDELDQADLLIINTCSIREKAEHRLYSEVGTLREWKDAEPGRVLGVAGCVAQQQGDALLTRFGHIDFVFGPQNVHWLPAMVSAASSGRRSAQVEESRTLERFDLPERHPDYEGSAPGRAYATVMEGCDMFCAFCIVPHTRGREVSRPADAIVGEVETLARRGVLEVTLLGQTVNAYGRHDVRRSRERAGDAVGFAELLQRLSEIPGIQRLRYTSPHPLFYDDALIRAHAEIPALCPHVHLPVQSGSDAVLARMRRRYTADAYRRLADSLRRSRPGLTLSTDLIVGFPGETDADFRATLALVRDVEFVDSFSFKYSPRPGTAAAEMDEAVAPEVAQARLEELQSLQRSLTLAAHRARVGETTEILLQGPSRQGGAQRCGRDPGHRVVNVHFPEGQGVPTPGRLIEVEIVEATPHSLIGEWCGVADELPVPNLSGREGPVHVKGPRRSADEQGRSAPLRG
jgi:tRNA-2-methylthio-N6-dimethylallyladenosine synthase